MLKEIFFIACSLLYVEGRYRPLLPNLCQSIRGGCACADLNESVNASVVDGADLVDESTVKIEIKSTEKKKKKIKKPSIKPKKV